MLIGVLGSGPLIYSPETEEVSGEEGEASDLCPGTLWMLIMLRLKSASFHPRGWGTIAGDIKEDARIFLS